MLTKVSEKFASKLVSAGVVSEENSDIYVYGCFQFIMLILNIITTLIISIVLHMVLQCVLLNAVYIPIRLAAGGNHADSSFGCYVNSSIMIMILLMIIRWIPVSAFAVLLMLGISSTIIILYAPVESKSNQFDEDEKRVCRKRSIIVLLIEVILSLIFLIIKHNELASIISLGLLSESIMVIVGMIKIRKST